MADLIVIIEEKGFATYRDLVKWAATQFGDRHPTLGQIPALYRFHFGITDKEARRLVAALNEMGFIAGYEYDTYSFVV